MSLVIKMMRSTPGGCQAERSACAVYAVLFGLGMFITDSAKKELIKLERNKFMKGDWPALLKKADQLDIDLTELINKS